MKSVGLGYGEVFFNISSITHVPTTQMLHNAGLYIVYTNLWGVQYVQ
jgi:hypothetical protein